ncbi:MAG: glycosyltransferase family 2 protein [Patescibacteria group bacterium]|nr:glycosyltransferase family 2 protein [Patescibacteria group bacterium]
MDERKNLKDRISLPLVSIIIACRNEKEVIDKCLDSLIGQTYPSHKIEILVVDGMSEDKTREIVRGYSKKYSSIHLFDNIKRNTPCAFNIGIKESKGEVITIASGHAIYQKNYISTYVESLKKYNADCVGGLQTTSTSKNSYVAKSIVFCLSSLFGVGNALYRIANTHQQPKIVDTVPFACYKRKVFEKIGLFNEKLVRSQDMEFNIRLKRAGGKIILIPEIMGCYYPQNTNLRKFFIYHLKDGFWSTYPLKFVKTPYKLRHYIPLIFLMSLFGMGILGTFSLFFFRLFLSIFGLYLLANLYFSIETAIKEKNFKYFFIMPIVFGIRHIGYGLGSIWGLIKILKPEK